MVVNLRKETVLLLASLAIQLRPKEYAVSSARSRVRGANAAAWQQPCTAAHSAAWAAAQGWNKES